MNKTKEFAGTWSQYMKELNQLGVELNGDNWSHFLECWQLNILPAKGVNLLE